MPGPIPRRRTRARELALQFLYQVDLNAVEEPRQIRQELEAFFGASGAGRGGSGRPDMDAGRTDDARSLDSDLPARAASPEIRAFARELIEGTLAARARIDELLRKVARNWDLRRMATIDRNVLRLAVYELLEREDIPPKVTINEAIELAKRYSTANSGGFVNGILDRVRIDYADRRAAPASTSTSSGEPAPASSEPDPPPAPPDDGPREEGG